MKQYLSVATMLICAVLFIALIVIKHVDNAQHESDVGTITDFSNRLDSAHAEISMGNGRILILSNSLDESSSAALTFSNQWMVAQSNAARGTEQITSLASQVAKLESENQTLNLSVTNLTGQLSNQTTNFTQQLTAAKASLDQANKDYALLENRLRQDVAERLVIQRKFYNPAALQAQLQKLKDDPFIPQTTEQSIYAGLDVEVSSNNFHVISPN